MNTIKKTFSYIGVLLITFILVSCVDSGLNSSISSSTINSTSSNYTSSINNNYTRQAQFIYDNHSEVTIYSTSSLSDGSKSIIAYSKDATTGELATNSQGSVYFSISVENEYELASLTVTPTTSYDVVAEVENELISNVYVIKNLSSNVVVTITTNYVGPTAEIVGYKATFIVDDHIKVKIYDTQDLTNGKITNTAYAKDGDSGEILTNGDGQINFVVVVDDGYDVNEVKVTPSSNYKNLKLPAELGENTYRITKIKGDLSISITTKVSDGSNTFTGPIITINEKSVSIENDNGGITSNDGVITISNEGKYKITGSTNEGSIIINGNADMNFTFILENLSLTSQVNSPINIINANKVVITIKGNVTLKDNRPVTLSEEDDTANAALYANADMIINGSGTLNVNAIYNNGIGTKDDLIIDDVTINVTSANHAIKGNDSLTINAGIINVTSVSGDGLKTSNSNISSKGNQRGTITINGGTITINTSQDGIDAAYDVVIRNNPIISINTTSTYATGVSEPNIEPSQTLYLRLSSALYSTEYRYAIYLTNSTTGKSEWINATTYTPQTGTGGIGPGPGPRPGQNYNYYKLDYPTEFNQYTLYRFTSTQPNSADTYDAKTEKATINTSYNMISINSISGSTVTVSWTMYTTLSNPNSNDLSYSAKGIKADNTITIDGGTITIRSYDDGIHAKSDVLLENNTTSLGNVTINGGNITITTKDDAIHADRTLIIKGGYINVLTSYEGVEANTIQINGGIIYVIATDDGINAVGSYVSPSITVNNGYLDITVGNGDTDAIDSNGTYTQKGGVAISRSANSGGMGGALDTDSSVSITGGTFIGLGVSERVPGTNSTVRSSGTINVSIPVGEYVVKSSNGDVIASFTTKTNSYSRIFVVSDQLVKGTSYSIYRNDILIKSWTQN
jgi:hypothetical protein